MPQSQHIASSQAQALRHKNSQQIQEQSDPALAQSAPPQFRNNHNQMMGEHVVLGIPHQATLGVLGEPQDMGAHITNVLA